ncbi:MAG: GNAT family N-acetyltransferase [Jatrophihabitantaceae bacterium]
MITEASADQQPILVTKRLVLRRWQQRDLAPFAALNADPDVMRYFLAPLDRAASDSFVDRIETRFAEHGYGLWAVELRGDGQFIGFIGLARHTFPAHFNPAVEVGWRLARSAWGHGYATEGARAALDYAFGPAQLSEVVSMTAVLNEPSQAVMRRLGMTREPADDFDYPSIPSGHPLRPHVLYRLSRETWLG